MRVASSVIKWHQYRSASRKRGEKTAYGAQINMAAGITKRSIKRGKKSGERRIKGAAKSMATT